MKGNYITRWMPGNRRTKYGAKSTVTGGRKYDSKMEATYAQKLELRKLAGEVKEVFPQCVLGIYIGGSLWAKWTVDFKVIMKDDSVELHEVKGLEMRDYVMRRNAFLLCLNSECDCNYVTEYKTGKRIEKGTELIVIK